MEQQVLLDKLSEFLMVEQGGLELYRVAFMRCQDDQMKQHYRHFGEETARHREILVELITQLGGDPNYVSPTARLAQIKASDLLQSSLKADGLSAEEVAANDLENLLLAETKDHADWSLLSKLVQQVDDGDMKKALQRAVDEVEPQEDEHLEWAREQLSQMCLKMIMEGPVPSPTRWQAFITAPEPAINVFTPRPVMDGLMEPARQPQWQETPISRAVKQGKGFMPR